MNIEEYEKDMWDPKKPWNYNWDMAVDEVEYERGMWSGFEGRRWRLDIEKGDRYERVCNFISYSSGGCQGAVLSHHLERQTDTHYIDSEVKAVGYPWELTNLQGDLEFSCLNVVRI